MEERHMARYGERAKRFHAFWVWTRKLSKLHPLGFMEASLHRYNSSATDVWSSAPLPAVEVRGSGTEEDGFGNQPPSLDVVQNYFINIENDIFSSLPFGKFQGF